MEFIEHVKDDEQTNSKENHTKFQTAIILIAAFMQKLSKLFSPPRKFSSGIIPTSNTQSQKI